MTDGLKVLQKCPEEGRQASKSTNDISFQLGGIMREMGTFRGNMMGF